jgi:hypothetical protein
MHRGSCLCGSIQYTIESDLKAIVNCHCRFCRKAHGAAFTTLLFMPFSNLTIVTGAELVARYHLSTVNADRCFCAKCGTRLYNHAPAAGMVSLVVATLEVDAVLRPVAHINTESKSAGFHIADDLPQFATMPSPADFRQLLSS